MSLFASWGPYWVKRQSTPPPVAGKPVFQAIYGWLNSNPMVINNLVSIDPNQYNRPAKMISEPINDAGNVPVASDGNLGSLYDPRSDMLYTINNMSSGISGFPPSSGFGNTGWAASCIDPREVRLVWRTDLTALGYDSVVLIGTSFSASLNHHLCWYFAYDAATFQIPYIISLSAVDGSVVHTLQLEIPLPIGGSRAPQQFPYNTMVVLNDDTISLGLFVDGSQNYGVYYMIYLKVLSPTTYSAGYVNLPSDGTFGYYYPVAVWSDHETKAYVGNYISQSGTPAPLFEEIDLNTMTITATVDAPVDDNIEIFRFQVNEDKTKLFISISSTIAQMWEYTLASGVWGFTGAYGTDSDPSGNSGTHYQADEYVYDDGYIYSFTQNNSSMMKWKVGDYSLNAPFFGEMWRGYRNYNINYGFHEFAVFNSAASAYSSGHTCNFWLLPKAKRAFTPPTYDTVPPATRGPLQLGKQSFNVDDRVTWFEYDFTGLDSVRFDAFSSNYNPYSYFMYVYDSEGKLLNYRSGNRHATITRNTSLKGKYYIALVQSTFYTDQFTIGELGWKILTDGMSPGQIDNVTITVSLTSTES